MPIVDTIKTFVNNSITVSEKNKELIKDTAKKIIEFVKEHKSLVFFGLTILFSFYMAPVSALEGLDYFGFSIVESFIEGALIGSSLLLLKNLFSSNSITKNQDDKINYLAGISNIGQTYLCPTYGLVNAVSTSGFIALKSIFNYIFPSEDRKIYFLMEKA